MWNLRSLYKCNLEEVTQMQLFDISFHSNLKKHQFSSKVIYNHPHLKPGRYDAEMHSAGLMLGHRKLSADATDNLETSPFKGSKLLQVREDNTGDRNL